MRPISSSPARRRTAALGVALVVATALSAAGCGGDEQAAAPGPQPSAAPPADEARKPGEPAPTGSANEQDPGRGGSGDAPAGAPEGEDPATAEHDDREPGAGDEEPARTEAVLTGRGGSIGPREVRVAAYIAVLVRLRSGDGARYALSVDGRTLTAGPGAGSDDETMLEGLPPGGRYVARPAGGGASITISASGEPGP